MLIQRAGRVAILHDNTAYGRGLAEETKKSLNAAGMQETMFSVYTPGERDYSAIVSRMQQANVNVIYVGGYHTEAGLLARQMKEYEMQQAEIAFLRDNDAQQRAFAENYVGLPY